MDKVITAKAYVFGKNIDTDQICAGKYLELTNPEDIAFHCLEGARSNFAAIFKAPGIVCASENFGCGSSREHAAISLKTLGISAVIAKSFARIFYRNGINLGLPLIVCREIDTIAEEGATMQIDLVKSIVANLDTGKSVPCDPVSDYMMQILEAGGIKKMMIEQNMHGTGQITKG